MFEDQSPMTKYMIYAALLALVGVLAWYLITKFTKKDKYGDEEDYEEDSEEDFEDEEEDYEDEEEEYEEDDEEDYEEEDEAEAYEDDSYDDAPTV